MLSGVGLPRDGELDEAANVTVALARGAVDFSFGSTFVAVLLPVAMLRVLAVKASLPVPTAVVHPPIPVTIETPRPAFAITITTCDPACTPAAMAAFCACGIWNLNKTSGL